jgi:hypothetical protein
VCRQKMLRVGHTDQTLCGAVVTSRAWRELKAVSAREGLIAIPYEQQEGQYSRIYQFAKLVMFGASSGLFNCPLAMTDGAAAVCHDHRFDSPSVLQLLYVSIAEAHYICLQTLNNLLPWLPHNSVKRDQWQTLPPPLSLSPSLSLSLCLSVSLSLFVFVGGCLCVCVCVRMCMCAHVSTAVVGLLSKL